MNERAIKLYQEACEFAYVICRQEGRTGGPSDHIWNTLSTGRFAELIVRECANIVNSLEQYEGQGDCSTAEYIKEHFGVEL